MTMLVIVNTFFLTALLPPKNEATSEALLSSSPLWSISLSRNNQIIVALEKMCFRKYEHFYEDCHSCA